MGVDGQGVYICVHAYMWGQIRSHELQKVLNQQFLHKIVCVYYIDVFGSRVEKQW